MRNLNGYEINGRNLRVDFADGGERSSNTVQAADKNTAGSNGEMMIQAIENAVAQFGTLKTYEMLISLKEHARQRPEMTKNILNSNPILTHAIVQCFKSLNIPILASGEASTGLLLVSQSIKLTIFLIAFCRLHLRSHHNLQHLLLVIQVVLLGRVTQTLFHREVS